MLENVRPVQDVINDYIEGRIEFTFEFSEYITITQDDRLKYNLKVFPNVDAFPDRNDWKDIYPKLIEYCKIHGYDATFLMDMTRLLKKSYTWEQAIIYYYNNRKILHPQIKKFQTWKNYETNRYLRMDKNMKKELIKVQRKIIALIRFNHQKIIYPDMYSGIRSCPVSNWYTSVYWVDLGLPSSVPIYLFEPNCVHYSDSTKFTSSTQMPWNVGCEVNRLAQWQRDRFHGVDVLYKREAQARLLKGRHRDMLFDVCFQNGIDIKNSRWATKVLVRRLYKI